MSKSSVGSATAEFALLLPVGVALIIGAVTLASQQYRELTYSKNLGTFAREIEAGYSIQQVQSQANAQQQNLSFFTQDGLLCLKSVFRFQVLQVQLANTPIVQCSLVPGN